MPPVDPTPGTSDIAGRGLFASVDLAAGEHALSIAREVTEPVDLGLLNHSCDPTLAWSGARDLVALRDVPAGAELTVDYSTAIDDDRFVLWCHCGTTRCRQAVEGRDWQIPQLQRRYAGHWAPRLQLRLDNLPG